MGPINRATTIQRMSFQSIRGQERPISLLQSYIVGARLEGGYLFSGPDGIGKQMAARNVAKLVNCLQEEASDACGQCPSCKKIDSNQHPDVHIIASDGGEIKIESIRQLQREISLRPYEGRKKVFILDDAHRLNSESSNALLKVLEEPPRDSIIVLISDKPNLIFKTIISRCKIIKFAPMKRLTLEEILKKDFLIDGSTAHFLAYFCEGRLGKALRLKDSAVFQDKNKVIDSFVFSPRLNLEKIGFKDKAALRGSLNILAAWFRDVYLLKTGMPQAEMINFDRWEDLSKQASRYSYQELTQILGFIPQAINYLERNINTKLLLYYLGEQLWKA
ncbi:MAG: DNA polymerase III subunit delta' [Candidatus Omnitrophota bacterium]